MSVDPDLPPLPRRPSPASVLAVATGGAVGALARAGVARLWGHGDGAWAWSTFAVNMVGAVAIGFGMVLLARRVPTARWARPLLVTGFLGGFTTYSTFALEAVEMTRHGRDWLAVTYVAVTMAGIVAACLVGLLLARRVIPGRPDSGVAPS